MFYDAEGLIEFCSKHKVTTEQFLLCYLVHTRKLALIYKYVNEVRMFPEVLVQDLVDRNILMDMNKTKEFYPDLYVLQDSMADHLVIFLGEEADELFDTFPHVIESQSMNFAARNISPEELARMYPAKLKRSKSTHQQVIQALREQIDNGTVGMGLRKWVETEQWKREDNSLFMDYTVDG